MKLETISKKVVFYCEIPPHLTEKHWISEHSCDSYVITHIDKNNMEPLDEWLLKTYPELEFEDDFFIHLDY